MKDQAGKELAVGDFVAYGARSGNSGALRLGIVTNIEKSSILTGSYYQTYNHDKQDYDGYSFDSSTTQGHGVDGGRLLKIVPSVAPEAYLELMKNARRFL